MIAENVIDDLKNGKEQALDQIIEQYQVSIYNTCLGMVQQEEEAEEITQDVFVKVYQNIRSFKGDSAFATWMYRIAVNESLMHLRRKKTKKRITLLGGFFGLGREKEMAVEFNHPGVAMEKKEDAKLLFKAIEKLPENQKVAIVLKNMEGLPQQEIAAVLHVSVGAVESLLQRAKQNLKKEIESQLK